MAIKLFVSNFAILASNYLHDRSFANVMAKWYSLS